MANIGLRAAKNHSEGYQQSKNLKRHTTFKAKVFINLIFWGTLNKCSGTSCFAKADVGNHWANLLSDCLCICLSALF